MSHKLRESEGLLSLWIGKKHNIIEMHVSAFFNKVIDIEGSKKYKESAKELLLELYKTSTFKETDGETETHNSQKASEELTKTIYGMLRTAKFINGEEDDK